MGAWGHRNFENDDAADFTADFREALTEDVLLEALTVVIDAGDEQEYIEASEASAALVAAEIVAASLSKPAPDFPTDLREIVAKLDTGANAEIRKMARKATKQILKKSELQELWAENGEPNDWQAVQQDLLARLK